MDNSSQLCLKHDVQALVVTFDSMKEMSIDSSFSEAEQIFTSASSSTWLKEGLWGFPDYRMSNLASIQAKALNTINALTAVIEQSRNKTDIDPLRSLLQGLIHAYQQGSLRGLGKLATFRSEAALWHTSNKLEKLSASILGFKQNIENALKLAHFSLSLKSYQLGGVSANPGSFNQLRFEELSSTPISHQEPMKRGTPPPPPTAPMKVPTFLAQTFPKRASKGNQDWSSLVLELKNAIADPRLKPIGKRPVSQITAKEGTTELLEILNTMRRDLSNSGLPEMYNWEDD